jgi:hypothetical protein
MAIHGLNVSEGSITGTQHCRTWTQCQDTLLQRLSGCIGLALCCWRREGAELDGRKGPATSSRATDTTRYSRRVCIPESVTSDAFTGPPGSLSPKACVSLSAVWGASLYRARRTLGYSL